MKKTGFILSVLALLAGGYGQAQEILVKDLDGDNIMDTIRIEIVRVDENENSARIICFLSSRQFEKIQSQIAITYTTMGLTVVELKILPTKNGFEFYSSFSYQGFHEEKAQFRYDRKTEKIQLIGMARTSTGNADRHREGKSSVNLLTGDYIGDWYLLEPNLDKLIKIPTIKTKMDFGKIYLEDFDGYILADFSATCNKLRYEQERKIIEKMYPQ
jgi:hypothetical protein